MTIEIKPKLVEVDSVFICHGAEGSFSHTFKIAGMEDSPWVNHGVSLNPATDESSPIGAEPRIGEYQRLEPEGAEWKLNCPANGTDRDFELWIQSEFTAPPYKIPMRLGHYRRKILSSRAPIGAPVIHDEVDAEVTVGSWYTAQELEGVDVEWWVDGKPEKNVPTSNTGKSVFKYAFLEDGPHTIVAKVVNPYDETELVEKHFEVHVFEESPWKQATLLINGNEVPWNTAITLLRGQANDVTVEAPLEIAEKISLWLPEDGGLDIEASPPFEEWVSRIDGKFHWTLTPGEGQSGLVTPVFKSRSVLQGWEHRCFVLSADLADEVAIEIDDEPDLGDDIWFFRDQPRTVRAIPKPGSPLEGSGYPLKLSFDIQSGLDPDNLKSNPPFDTEQSIYSWEVTGSTKRGTFRLRLEGKDMTTPVATPVCTLLSSDLADEASVKILGTEIPPEGVVFFRAVPLTLILTPKPGSLLGRLPVSMQWVTGTEMNEDDLNVEPNLNIQTSDHRWKVTGSPTKSGTFQLKLVGKGMAVPLTLPICTLISPDINDEADITIGNKPVTEGNVFIRDEAQSVIVAPKVGSPLAGLKLALKYEVKTGLDPHNLKSVPDFDTFQNDHSWEVTGSAKSGTFQLYLWVGGTFVSTPLPISTLLSNNIADDADIAIDGKPIPAEGNVFYWGQPQSVTCTPKADNPLTNVKMTLSCDVKTGLDPDNVVSVPGFDSWQEASDVTRIRDTSTAVLDPKTFKWEVTGTTNVGDFQLGLAVQGMTSPNLLAVSKLMPSNIADEVVITIDGLPPETSNRFYRDETRKITVTIKDDSPLKGAELMLKCTVLSGLDPSNVTSTPIFESWQKEIYSWEVIGSTKSGFFQLSLHVKNIEQSIILDCRLQSSNLADEVVPYLDGKELNFYGDYFVPETPRVLTFGFKNANVMDGVSLALDWAPYNNGVASDALSSEPSFGIDNPTRSWKITGASGSYGLFQFKLFEVGGRGEYCMPMHMLVSEDVKFRFEGILPGGGYPFPPYEEKLGQGNYNSLAVKLTTLDGQLIPGHRDGPVKFYINGHERATAHIDENGVARYLPLVRLEPGLNVLEAIMRSIPAPFRIVRWVRVV